MSVGTRGSSDRSSYYTGSDYSSSYYSGSTRSGLDGVVGRTRLTWHRKRPKRPSDYKWTVRQVDEQNAALQELGLAMLEGREVSRLHWYRVDKANRKARVVDPKPPGPGTYMPEKDITSMGKQAKSLLKSNPAFTIMRGTLAKSVSKHPLNKNKTGGLGTSYRLKNEPREMAAPRVREGELTETDKKKVRTMMGTVPLSKWKSAPSFTMSSKLEKKVKKQQQAVANPIMDSAIGRQFLSHRPTKGRAVMGIAKRGNLAEPLAADPYPSVHSYYPKYDAPLRTAPAFTLKGNTDPEYNPFLDCDAAPGSYESAPPSMGKQTLAGRKTGPRVVFGAPDVEPDMRMRRYLSSHDRRQPAHIRPVKSKNPVPKPKQKELWERISEAEEKRAAAKQDKEDRAAGAVEAAVAEAAQVAAGGGIDPIAEEASESDDYY